MFSALFSNILVQLNISIILVLLFILALVLLGIKYNNSSLLKYTRSGMNTILGFFGVFRCQDGVSYCYLGFSLKGRRLAIALLLELGIIILAIHIGFAFLLGKVGTASILTRAAPIICYFAYPVLMYCFRKKCS